MIETFNINTEKFQNEQTKLKTKKRIIIISLLLILIIILIILGIIIIKFINKKSNVDPENEEKPEIDVLTEFNLSTFFYFDPVSKEPCNEKNYWTPFDNTTTCYR